MPASMPSHALSPLEQIRHSVLADLDAVDAMIRRELTSDVALVNQVSGYIIGAGGKRLRPLLVLLAARAAGAAALGPQIAGAVIIEFIHTATLLHDDVVDGSSQRRGRHTANEVWGNATSVLVGDFLYSRAFQLMVSLNSLPVMGLMADATNVIAEGEVLQIMHTRNPATSEQHYLDVIYRKTARLFESGAQVGALLAGADAKTQTALATYAKHLGNAFQLVDDSLDYRSSPAERGKNIGDDLAEGKPTLPIIHALRTGSATQQALLTRAIESGGLEDLPAVIAAIESCGSLEYTAMLAKSEADQALQALKSIPESIHTTALQQLAEFSISRSY